jgi:hypothetical protein
MSNLASGRKESPGIAPDFVIEIGPHPPRPNQHVPHSLEGMAFAFIAAARRPLGNVLVICHRLWGRDDSEVDRFEGPDWDVGPLVPFIHVILDILLEKTVDTVGLKPQGIHCLLQDTGNGAFPGFEFADPAHPLVDVPVPHEHGEFAGSQASSCPRASRLLPSLLLITLPPTPEDSCDHVSVVSSRTFP